MDFQEFKGILENNLKVKFTFELLEYHYLLYLMGSGVLAYRINGFVFRFTYDGKDSILTIEKSNYHDKYKECNWTKIYEQSGLNVDSIIKIL